MVAGVSQPRHRSELGARCHPVAPSGAPPRATLPPGPRQGSLQDSAAPSAHTESTVRVGRSLSSLEGTKPGAHQSLHQTQDASAGIQAREAKLYLCAIKDVFSNRIVGWSTDSRMKARLVVAAIEMAVARRDGDVAGCILHSDRGSQFCSRKVQRTLTRH
jgi:transposase InsO family protein